MTKRNPQQGFSILEVLIALFVFAIGILTVAGLQIVSKRTNYEAIQRTTATYVAYDILERMRANPSQLGGYVNVSGNVPAQPGTNCRTTACGTAELAAFDAWEWQQAIQGVAEQNNGNNVGGLVVPTGCVDGPAAGGQGLYTITIVWRGTDALPDAKPDNECGDSKTDEDEYGPNLEYRRVIELTTFIAP